MPKDYGEKELSVLDVIQLNKIIFGPVDKETEEFNQSHRSYTVSSIFQILDFQKKNKLNNTQVALYFKLSRHTVAKWKKKYLIN
ncbi:helix-turn-helix domain-containing protein [Chryseobacterium nematophagum]|uniref:helix-turn-helix domain-containing protein n=1 Tax=Chryseobacterium nematophagum TaxID=2305228 RepID=UPI0026CB013B|nr:helix-turn-helix domain-containing protein [Chryseobacterium nematophagum]